jgi:tripartite-type tricarboxylate transporter receptor subunit TctC
LTNRTNCRCDTEDTLTRRHTLPSLAIIHLSLLSCTAAAQSFPVKPIRVVVPFPPGGGADLVARVLAPPMNALLGHQLVIDNRPGGSGIIGMEVAAKAVPDGHTLVIGITGTLAINPSMFPKLPYDPVGSFAPISLAAIGPNVLVVHPSLAARSIEELVSLAKQRPGALSYASSGTGGAPHLAGELFKYMAKIDIVHVPYKGAAPATIDVLGGHVPMMFAGLGAALPHIRNGRLRPLGVAAPKRSSELPQVPAIAEYLPGFSAETWFGVLAPQGTSAEIVARLNSAIHTAAARKDVKDQLRSSGYEVVVNTPQQFSELIQADMKKWAMVISKAGIKAE